jgi:hypothetical protein
LKILRQPSQNALMSNYEQAGNKFKKVLSKEIENIKVNQMETLKLGNTITEIKHAMDGISRRMEET